MKLNKVWINFETDGEWFEGIVQGFDKNVNGKDYVKVVGTNASNPELVMAKMVYINVPPALKENMNVGDAYKFSCYDAEHNYYNLAEVVDYDTFDGESEPEIPTTRKEVVEYDHETGDYRELVKQIKKQCISFNDALNNEICASSDETIRATLRRIRDKNIETVTEIVSLDMRGVI